MLNCKRRPIALLNLRKSARINDFIAKMRGYVANIELHPDEFINPNPPLSVFIHNINELQNAMAKTETGVRTSVPERNIKYDIVLDNAYKLLHYVQEIANNAPDNNAAVEKIIAAGFDVKKDRIITKNEFEAKNTDVSGKIKLTAKAVAPNATYLFYMSEDKENWEMIDARMQVSTIISGLTRGKTIYFKVRAVTREGLQDYSNVIELLIN